MGRDVEHEPDGNSEYECFHCQKTVTGTNYQIECPSCGQPMRNRGTPLE